jgi:hypothetical protein
MEMDRRENLEAKEGRLKARDGCSCDDYLHLALPNKSHRGSSARWWREIKEEGNSLHRKRLRLYNSNSH